MPRHMFQITVNVPTSQRNNINNNDLLNPYIFVRNRLYHFVFNRFCLLYAKIFSEFKRKIIEFFVLVVALFCFITLVYVHVMFVQTPMNCLENYKDIWQSNGILRIEIISRKGKENYTLDDSYWKEKALRLQQQDLPYYNLYQELPSSDEEAELTDGFSTRDPDNITESPPAFGMGLFGNSSSLDSEEVIVDTEFQPISEDSILATDPEGAYIIEFSLEYGFLRLRPVKRKELNISVTFVLLDPDEDVCFGGSFNKFLLDNILGYDYILLSSIKNMAEKKEQKGFVRNAVWDIEYIFVSNWVNEKSYITAGVVMLIFTLTISTLLRHSHHQIFIVVGYWMNHVINAMQRATNFFDAIWPRNLVPTSGAPILTVVLALVGMEAVMSDFFHDRAIALYVIVIVWFADLYDAVCCQSPLSKRHWFKFFYLYHFLFYAYNYKFSGVYWPLTLMTSWLFTLHSMVFFFHHYELPRFLHRIAQMNATNHANHPAPQNNQHNQSDLQPGPADDESNNNAPTENNHQDMIREPGMGSHELPSSSSQQHKSSGSSSASAAERSLRIAENNTDPVAGSSRCLKASASVEDVRNAMGDSIVRASSVSELRSSPDPAAAAVTEAIDCG